jgi:hypothetical protein
MPELEEVLRPSQVLGGVHAQTTRRDAGREVSVDELPVMEVMATSGQAGTLASGSAG